MNIIGAGLTGLIAAYAFKDAVIHEYLKEPRVHKAVLRFRTEEVSKLTGIPFKKVLVHKAVAYGGAFVTPNLLHMNHYSLKVAGGYYERSIGNLEPSVRYIAPLDFHQQMIDHHKDRIFFGSDVPLTEMTTPVISTLPLNVLVDKFKLDAQLPKEALHSNPIYVTTVDVTHCDLYQTIYFPELSNPVYRASITGNQIIIESMLTIGQDRIKDVIKTFGISGGWTITSLNFEQKIGKFNPLEENYRKQLMYDITTALGIYSLGRHATWRKILLDDVVNDIQRIESMLKTSAYDRMLGKTK
ncbi:hypothetical protein PBZ58_005027 [Klebsiella pneumoniae]|nr:hypothetical protein [Klebsiella pneumoniae]